MSANTAISEVIKLQRNDLKAKETLGNLNSPDFAGFFAVNDSQFRKQGTFLAPRKRLETIIACYLKLRFNENANGEKLS